ncbi:hypothetical protein AGMMS50230_12410 [Spirochaetia bacterium]|nr:hypothetical protein AGMMS50230_12410 [Spirochaetia bacterium]
MFNFKASGIAAGTGFILSLIIGFVSGAGIGVILVRALVFGMVFFGLSCFIFWLLAQFVPELLTDTDDNLDIPLSGSRIDISVGGPIIGAFPTDSSGTVDDIGGRPSTPPPAKNSNSGIQQDPLDQDVNTGYNGDRGSVNSFEDFSGAMPDSAVSQETKTAEVLPDMDNISDVPPGGGLDAGFDSEPRRPLPSTRKSEMAGDFNPKELAQAIRTVLVKDEKG